MSHFHLGPKVACAAALISFFSDAAGAAQYTATQMDRIIARSEAHKPEFQKFAAVAQSVYFTEIVQRPRNADERMLSLAMGEDPLDIKSSHWTGALVDTDKLMQHRLKSAADRTAQEFDPAKVRGSWIDVGITVGLAGAVALSKNPKLGLLAPPTHEMIVRYLDKDVKRPDFPQDFTTDWAVWGLSQCRGKGDTAAALKSFCDELDGGALTKNEENHPAVVSAKALEEAIRNRKSIDEILDKLQLNDETIKELSNDISVLASPDEVASEAEKNAAAEIRTRAVHNLQNASGSLTIAAAAFKFAGDERTSTALTKMAGAADGLSNLAENAEKMAPMMLAGGYVAIGLSILSAIEQSQQQADNPYPKLFSMLIAISKQIDDLRLEMQKRFAQLDSDMTSLFSREYHLTEVIGHDTTAIREEIANIEKTLHDIDARVSVKFQELAEIYLNDEDRRCFQRTGSGSMLPLSRAGFVSCRDIYVTRSTTYAKSQIANDASQDGLFKPGLLISAFPFASDYDRLREAVDSSHQRYQRPLSNPAIWAASANSLLAVIANNPEHFRDIGVEIESGATKRTDLDDVIGSGRDLMDFVNSVALKGNGDRYALRTEAFQKFVDSIFSSYQHVTDKAGAALSVFPVALDPLGGPDQDINPDIKFTILNQAVPFCQNSEPKVLDFKQVFASRGGGAHGSAHLFTPQSMGPQAFNDWIKIFQGQLDTLKKDTFIFDKSLMYSLPRPIVLMEQIRDHDAVIHACFDKFEVSGLYQDTQQAVVSIDFQLKVFLQRSTQTGNSEKLVYVGKGHFAPKFPFGSVKFDPAKRVEDIEYRFGDLVRTAWKQLAGKFSDLSSVHNEEAEANLEMLRGTLASELDAYRDSAKQKVLSSLDQENSSFARDRKGLEALTAIGLSLGQVCVEKWIGVLRSADLPADLKLLVDMSMGVGARPIEFVKETIETSHKKVLGGLSDMSNCRSLSPPAVPLRGIVAQLEQVRSARIAIEQRAIADARPR